MASNFNPNDSMMSSASAISAIGLEQTMTEEFQELKGLQAEVQGKVFKVTDSYKRVKDFVVDDSKDESGAILIELEQFDEDRHAAVEALMDYYIKTALAVRLFIDENSRVRVKKIHRFMNTMKKCLLRTKEMAADGEPRTKDQQFLEDQEKMYPLSMIPEGTFDIPTPQSPRPETTMTTQEKRPTTKGYSEIASSYLLRGKGMLESLLHRQGKTSRQFATWV